MGLENGNTEPLFHVATGSWMTALPLGSMPVGSLLFPPTSYHPKSTLCLPSLMYDSCPDLVSLLFSQLKPSISSSLKYP